MKLLVINGPNLNMLGNREPSTYGNVDLMTIEAKLRGICEKEKCELDFFQSNYEGELISKIQKSINDIDGILINAGAYTHTSIALRDALLAVDIVFIEVHLSNVFSREDFRHNSLLADKALGVISGFGAKSYDLALEGLINFLRN